MCVDNDPQALEATAENATRNGISDVVRCLMPEAYVENSADFVLANILAGPLVELARALLDSVKPEGKIVLSGILEEQAETVINAYRPKQHNICQSELEGWVRLEIQGVERTLAKSLS